jgi:hypothetical protein
MLISSDHSIGCWTVRLADRLRLILRVGGAMELGFTYGGGPEASV